MRKEDFLRFYQSYRMYIFPIIVTLSGIILIVFIIFPQTMKLLTNQSAKNGFISKSKFLESKVLALESYDVNDLNLKLNYALDSFPEDKDFATAVGLLQDLSTKNGFNIEALVVGVSPATNASIQSYNIKLEIIGPLTSLKDLLKGIEGTSRIMRVNNFEITKGRDLKLISIVINVEILYSAPPKDFGSVDSPLPELSKVDQEVLARLARTAPAVGQTQTTTQPLGPRGKANPFE